MGDLLNVINDVIVLNIISYILCSYISADYASNSRLALIRRLATAWLIYWPIYVLGNIWLLYGFTSTSTSNVVVGLIISVVIALLANILLTTKGRLWHRSYLKMNVGFSIFVTLSLLLSYFGISQHLAIQCVFVFLLCLGIISMYKRKQDEWYLPINVCYVLIAAGIYILTMIGDATGFFAGDVASPVIKISASFIAMIGFLVYFIEKYMHIEQTNDSRVSMSQFQLREAYDEIEYASSHDLVTGLRNWKGLRTYFETRHNYQKHSVIVNVYLRGMGSVREWVTESEIEDYLRDVARFLLDEVKQRGQVFRAYNGNFVMVFPLQTQEAYDLMMDIINDIKHRNDFAIDGHHFALHCGISNISKRGNYEDDFKRAGIALRQIESSSNSGVVVYNQTYETALKSRLEFEDELKLAVENAEWEMYYQPKHRLSDGARIGMEALIRWKGKSGISYSPNHFIPVAEKRGWLDDIEKFVVIRSLLDFKQNPWFGSISINISPLQLRNTEFIAFIIEETEKVGIDPKRVTIEITESAYVENFEEAKKQMSVLHTQGFKISLDDFGAGYSSLRYLTELPFDEVKIDQAFVRGRGDLDKKYLLLSSLVTMLHQQGFETVIEGVENEDVYKKMQTLGVLTCQGYFLSKPDSITNLKTQLKVS